MQTAAENPGNISEALGGLTSAARFLAGADAAALTASQRAECLRVLEQADAAVTVARAGILGSFDAHDDFELDGQASAAAWLVTQTRISKAEAAAHRAWVRRKALHPLITDAMRDGILSRSWARKVMSLTGQIPEEFRQDADKIIVAAAAAGAQLKDLVYLAAEILARTAPASEDDTGFTDRNLRLEITFDGAGVLAGELSPECAAAVQAVLGELSKRCGKDDHRSHGERMHDGLLDAMMRLLGSELAPKKNGHPFTALVHIGLADVIALDDGSVLQQQWTARLAARWAGHRAATAECGGDGGAWINGPAAKGIACDAALFPVVTGEVDLGPLDELVRLCVELDSYRHGHAEPAGPAADRGAHEARIEELMRQIIGRCVAVLSGEPGLASFLRRNLLGQAGLGGPSLPLDVGDRDEVPWWLRRAVHLRDQGCQWADGCEMPAAGCQPHHIVHRADHGHTSLINLNDYCLYHHHIAIHRLGWTVTLHGDGTTEARSPDGRIFHRGSRPPPPRPG